VRAVRTRYVVEGWGEGELWTGDGVVLAHDFEFETVAAPVEVDGLVATERERDPGLLDPEVLATRVRAFLAGEDVSLADVPLDLSSATPFQRDILDALRAVPRGEVVSYGELAALAGYARAGRAVGTVCATNRFMLFVPCHRVVASNGIGGYGSAGVGVKRRLLALEGIFL